MAFRHPVDGGRRLLDQRPHAAARWGTVLSGVACAVAGGAVAGVPGLWSGVLGTLLVVGFFFSGIIPLLLAGGATPRVGPALALLLLTYTLRLALVLLALRLASRAGFLDGPWLGATIIVCALVWSALHLAVVIRGARTQ